MHRPFTQKTTKSNSTRNLSCALIPDPGFTITCATHCMPPKRPTALILSREKKPLHTSTQGIIHRAAGPNFRFHQYTILVGIDTVHGVHAPEWINYTSTTPQHNLKRTASSCSLGQLENEYIQEGRDRDFPLECLHFSINHRFTERFWHQSQYLFALADRQNDYSDTFFTHDVATHRIYQKYDPFFLQLGF